MSKKYLVAIDGYDAGWKALDCAIEFAKATDASLTVLHVVPYEPMPKGLEEFARIEGISLDEQNARYHYSKTLGDGITKEGEKRVRAAGLTQVETHVSEGSPAAEIASFAEGRSMDMVFVGNRGYGEFASRVLGSVSNGILNPTHCTVVVVK
ncbi:MAG: universal stress protein [Pseudomonadota bacterium]